MTTQTQATAAVTVVVSGAGAVPMEVLAWLGACSRFSTFSVDDAGRVVATPRLPPPSRKFLVVHEDAVRRVLNAVPPRVM